MIAVGERMDIDAHAGADIRQVAKSFRQRLVGFREIGRGRHLTVLGITRDDRHFEPGKLGHRRIIGETRLPGLARFLMRGADGVEGEALRGLHRPQSGAVDGAFDGAGRRFLHRIGDGEARNGALMLFKAGDHPSDEISGDERTSGIMDEDMGDPMPGNRLETQPARLLAGFTACNGRVERQTGRGPCEKVALTSANDGLNMRDRRVITEGLQRPPDHRPPTNRLILLWLFAPGPAPSPGGDNHCANFHGIAL